MEHIQPQGRLDREEEIAVSRRMRIVLVVIGTTIVLISLLILAYAAWPGGATREQYRLSPTVFVQPQ
jgi:hypothetical protein